MAKKSIGSVVGPTKAQLQKAGEEYRCWEKAKHQSFPARLTPTGCWLLLKARRSLTRNAIRVAGYRFHRSTNNELPEALHFFDLHIGGAIGMRPAKANMPALAIRIPTILVRPHRAIHFIFPSRPLAFQLDPAPVDPLLNPTQDSIEKKTA